MIMPVKYDSSTYGGCRVYVNGSEFLQISGLEVPGDNKTSEEYTDTEPVELSADIVLPSGLSKSDLVMVLLGFCTASQIKKNNWRRMHGIPMKRRKVL